jgi:hypothetical protein
MNEAEQIMKRCQAGTRNYEEANNLHAACYGIIGKLLAQSKPLTDEAIDELNCVYTLWDDGESCTIMGIKDFARAVEAAHNIKENI